MATIWSTLSTKQKIIAGLISLPSPLMGSYILSFDPIIEKARREREKLKERNFFRNFRVEIRQGFFWDSTVIVQREKPLTDEEMELMYKESKS